MINANELRIGNWIKVGGYYHQWRLKDFNSKMEKYLRNEFYLPIPLTEQILLKAGFEKNEHEEQVWYEFKGEIKTWFGGSFDICAFKQGLTFSHNHIRVILESVHQLQNLFYWLSGGKELTINL